MTIGLIIVCSVLIGILIGNRLTWWHMSLEWKRNPYRLKTIVDGAIARREQKKQQEA